MSYGKIEKINPLSLARFQMILFTLFGFIAGIIYAFGGLIIDALVSAGWVVTHETPGLSYGTVLAFGALIGMPFIGATVGFVTGFIGALLYNVYAKVFGGFEIDFER